VAVGIGARAATARQRPPARPVEAPFLGVGVGLRPAHYGEVRARAPTGRLGVD